MEKEKRGKGTISVTTALRDIFVNFFPVEQLSPSWIKRLYCDDVTFVFLTHPRNVEDVFNVFPILKLLNRILPAKFLFGLLSLAPCFVVARVRTKQGLNGFFISTTLFPDELFNRRDKALRNAELIVKFIRKITSQKVYVGLAAWWPIVTNGGLAFNRFLKANDRIVITNGHCATLASIVLSINRICEFSHVEIKDLRLLVIGVGKMGGAVADYFSGRVSLLGLIDQNQMRLERLEKKLHDKLNGSETEKFVVSESNFSDAVLPALRTYHIAVCTTSNLGYVLNDKAVQGLSDCIILDDARPEAFPRVADVNKNVAILEGGLIKIDGLEVNSDFGFGSKDNVFGCLAEALLLNLDGLTNLDPTLGEVDGRNFESLLALCKKHGIQEGDFMCGTERISSEFLRTIITRKVHAIKNCA